MESFLFVLDLIAVVVLCHFAAKQDDAERLKTTELEKHDA
jgi:hypothetical protein